MRWLVISLVAAGCAGASDGDDEVEALDPTATGPYGVELVELDLDLGDRSDGFPSLVPTRVHAPVKDGALPVLLFSHGFAIRPDQYHDTLNHLASWGFVVVAPRWDSGFPSSRTHVGLAEDAIAAIDWLFQNDLPIDGTEEPSLLAAVGHSRGGKQSIHAATLEDRIVATFSFDPVDSAPPLGTFDEADYPSVTPELMPGLTVPSAVLGMGYGGEAGVGSIACAPVEDNYRSYFDAMPAGALELVLPTSGHNDLLDECAEGSSGGFCALCAPGDDPGSTRRLGAGFAVAFLSAQLGDGEGFEAWLDGSAEALAGASWDQR